MSITSAIENAQIKVENAYTAVENKGGTLPETQNLTNLPNAIESIPSGSGGDTILLENKSGTAISADDKVLCNLSAATSKPQKFFYYNNTAYNPLCIYNSNNFITNAVSSYSRLYSDNGLKEIKEYFSSLPNLAGYRNNYVYHPNGVISSAMASGWTGQDCYIVKDKYTLVTIPNKCQYLGSYDGTHYVFDRREGYHSIRTYNIDTNTIGTEVVSVPSVNYLYYGMLSGDKIFVYKQDFYAIYELQSATTATLLYSSSITNLAPFYMTGVEVGDYIFSVANYGAYYDVENSANKPAFLIIHRIKSDYKLERVHPKELEMFETTPCYFCYDNRSNILSIGTHNYAYFYQCDYNGFKRINVVFDELPNNSKYAYRAYMTPNKNRAIIQSMNNEYYFYDVKYPEQFISVDTSLTYDKESNITGYATGNTSSGKYEVSTVLPNVSQDSLDFGMYPTPDELSAYGNAGVVTKTGEKTYQIPVYDRVPYKLIMRKEGYYDGVWDYLNYPSILPLIITNPYRTYTGKNLIYSYKDNMMTIPIPSGRLPDKSVCNYLLGCLGSAGGGVCYENFTKVGSVYVNNKTGLATNFSTNDYITKELESLGNNWEIYCKFTTGSSTVTGGQEVFTLGTAGANNGYVYGYIRNDGTGMWWTIGSVNTSQFAISNNTTYYFKVGCDGEKTYVYVSTTGYESMTLLKEESTVVSVPAYTMFLGYNTTNDTKGAFKGIMDLSQTFIKVNGSVYWTANSGKYALTTGQIAWWGGGQTFLVQYGYDNFIEVGSVTVNPNTGDASNFSQSNYISIPLDVNVSTLDIITKGRISSTSSVCTVIGNDSLVIDNGYLACWYNTSYTRGSTLMSTNKDYWYRMIYDGTNRIGYILEDNNYTLDTLPDLSQWSQEFSIPRSWSSYTAALRIGSHVNQSTQYFRGTLYLSGFKVSCNGNEIWSPLHIEPTLGLLPSGVTDDGSAQTWNLFYDNGEFLADTTSPMTGYSWCGSVTVPAHTV